MRQHLFSEFSCTSSLMRNLSFSGVLLSSILCHNAHGESSSIDLGTVIQKQSFQFLDRDHQAIDKEGFPELQSVFEMIKVDELLSGSKLTTLVLTIDSRVQRVTQEFLEDNVRITAAKEGIVVVMNPSTGELLALAHTREKSSSDQKDQIEQKGHPAFMKDDEPGSLMKPLIVSFVAQEGELTSESMIPGYQGRYLHGQHEVLDAKPVSYMSPSELISNSSNIGALVLSQRLGVYRHEHYLKHFGFGKPTGIELSEANGVVPKLQSLKERKARIFSGHMAYGKGMSATPIQMSRAFAVIANGGYLVTPRLVKDTVISPNDRLRIMSETAVALSKEGLELAVNQGRSSNAYVTDTQVAGMTATTRKYEAISHLPERAYRSTFVGFGSTLNPRYLIYLMIDSPKIQMLPDHDAASLFSRIMRQLLELDHVHRAYELDPEEQYLP